MTVIMSDQAAKWIPCYKDRCNVDEEFCYRTRCLPCKKYLKFCFTEEIKPFCIDICKELKDKTDHDLNNVSTADRREGQATSVVVIVLGILFVIGFILMCFCLRKRLWNSFKTQYTNAKEALSKCLLTVPNNANLNSQGIEEPCRPTDLLLQNTQQRQTEREPVPESGNNQIQEEANQSYAGIQEMETNKNKSELYPSHRSTEDFIT